MATDLCRSCGSCGFPMRSPDDFAGRDPQAEYCSTCADERGALKPYDEVVQANADYLAREQGIDMQAARALARALLSSMPAWQGQR